MENSPTGVGSESTDKTTSTDKKVPAAAPKEALPPPEAKRTLPAEGILDKILEKPTLQKEGEKPPVEAPKDTSSEKSSFESSKELNEQEVKKEVSKEDTPDKPRPPRNNGPELPPTPPDPREHLKPKPGEKLPTYFDKYALFDAEGNQLFDPADPDKHDALTKQNLFEDNHGRIRHDVAAMLREKNITMQDINGKKIDADKINADKNEFARRRDKPLDYIRGKLYNALDRRYHFEALRSEHNAHNMELVQKIVGTGPDDEERWVYSVRRARDGQLQNIDGKPLNPIEIARYKREIKAAKANPPLYQGRAAYEIGKQAEPLQADLWLMMVNQMHRDFGWSHHEIMGVLKGLQFMKKASYLTFKHTDIVHPPLYEDDGETVKKDKHGKTLLDHSRYVFGELNEMDYAAELGDKFRVHEMQFGPADVAIVLRLAQKCKEELDAALYNPEMRQRREYRKAAYIMRKLNVAIAASRMSAAGVEPTEENMAQYMEQQAMQAAGKGMSYPPRISGSGEANAIWGNVAVVVDAAIANGHLAVSTANIEDYKPLSETQIKRKPDLKVLPYIKDIRNRKGYVFDDEESLAA